MIAVLERAKQAKQFNPGMTVIRKGIGRYDILEKACRGRPLFGIHLDISIPLVGLIYKNENHFGICL
jgi:hypothetical protein